MAQAFNLTAQINLRGPSNIGSVVSDIRRQIGSISANVNININPATTQNVARLNAALNNLNTTFGTTATAATRAANAINNFGNSINAIQIRNLPQQINNTNTALNNLNNNGVATARSLSIATNQMVDFGRQSALAVRRFAAFSIATGAIYSLSNAINQGIKSYIDYNKEIVRLQQVTGESAKGLKNLENQISGLATSFGVSSTELTTVSLTLAQAGLSARDTEKALKALALSSLAPSFDSMNETVEGSIALMRQFGISAGDLEKALGSINAVAAKFAVEASDIISAIQRTGGVFATASRGVSEGTDALNEFISVFTSVRATTRESSETIATGLRTIFTRIQRGSTIEALKEYGVNLQDLDGKFVGAYKAVELLSKGLNKIDPRELKFSKIVEELGGFRQIGKVIPLIQQFSTAQEALKVAQTGQSSLTKDAATAQLSLANQISKVREEFLALFREIGSSTSFQVMIKNALSLASAMIRIADSMKEVLPVLGTILAFRGANALIQYGAGFAGAIRGGAAPGRRTTGGSIGYNSGGTVNALLTPGEAVIEPQLAKKIGRSNLDRMNHADKIIKRNKGGGVKFVPGVGDGDTFGPVPLEQGSYVIRKKAVEAIGTEQLSNLGRYAKGGPVRASELPSALIKSRVKSANSKEAKNNPELFKKGYYLTDSDLIMFQKNEFGLDASPNIGALDFEKIVQQKIGGKLISGNAPIDIIGSKKGNVEVRNRQRTTKDRVLLDKFLREKILQNKPLISNTPNQDNLQFVDPVNVVYNTGKLERERFIPLNKRNLVRTYKVGGSVTAKDVLDYMSISDVSSSLAKKGIQLSPSEVGPFLRKRSFAPDQKSILDAILKEAQIASNRQAGAAQGSLTRRKNRAVAKGLVFGAAGLFGTPFPTNPLVQTIEDSRLKEPVTVSVYSGIFKDQKLASDIDSGFSQDIERSTRSATRMVMRRRIEAQRKKVGSILSGFETGKELNLDFDRTLAFGADKILADPRKPRFAEFGDRNKVAQALGQAKLSLLGNQLASLLKQKPGLINNVRVITARPKSTLDLIQGWLTSKGLPIPLSQFKGFGGPSVSGSDIAKLKAAELKPGSIFVDDDPRNIAAAKQREVEGITSYRYRGVRRLKSQTQSAEATESSKGTLLEGLIRRLGAVGTGKGRGFDFLNGLGPVAKEFRPFIPSNVPTDIKRTLAGLSTVKDNIVTYLKNVKGYSAGGEVPIMAQEGEYVINRASAQKIGYHNLDKLNKYHTGGTVRKFANGGPAIPAARPDVGGTTYTAAYNLVGITPAVNRQIADLAEELQELGLTSSETATLVQRGSQVSYAAATRAIEVDIRRARLAGASAEQIAAAESQLRNVRETAQRDVNTRRTLGGLSGEQLQRIDLAAQNERERLRENRRRSLLRRGMSREDVETRLVQTSAGIDRVAYERATRSVTGINVRASGLRGEDTQRYIQQSMRDRETLAQMDRSYISQRAVQIRQQLAAEQGVSGDRVAMRRLSAEAVRMAQEETRDRRRIINELARSQGMAGPGSAGLFGGIAAGARNVGTRALGSGAGRFVSGAGNLLQGNAGFFLPMAIASLGTAGGPIARSMTGDVVSQARKQARIESTTSTLGVGLGIAGGLAQTGNPYAVAAAGVIALGTGIYAAIDALADFSGSARKAGQEVAQAQRTKLIEQSSEQVADAFKALEKDVNNIKLKQILETKLSEQANLVQRDTNIRFNEMLNEGRSTRFTNEFGVEENKTYGNLLTRGVLGAVGYVTGADFSAKRNTPDEIRKAAIEAAGSPAAKSNAENMTRLIENRVLSGQKLSSLGVRDQAGNFTNKAFQDLVKTISITDAGFHIMEQSTKGMDAATAEATRAQYLRTKGEEVLASLLPIEKTRALNEAMELANRAGRKLAENLEKLGDGINQAVNATAFFSDQMKSDRQNRISRLAGESRPLEIQNRNVNILQNPLAYSGEEFSAAVRSSTSLLGNTRNAQLARGSLEIGRNLAGNVEQRIAASLAPGQNLAQNTELETLSTNIIKAGNDFIDSLGLGDDVEKQYQETYSKKIEALRQRIDKEKESNKELDTTEAFRQGVQEVAKEMSSFGKEIIALEQQYTSAVNDFINVYADASKKLKEAREFGFKAENIGIQSFQDIRKASTGVGVSLTETQIMRDRRVGRLTGGVLDPMQLAGRIMNDNAKAEEIATKLKIATENKDKAAIIQHTQELQKVNDQIDDNRKSLEDLANSTDVASAALESLSNIRALQMETVRQAEQQLTASPEENMRRMLARGRLSNILSGNPQANQPSREARMAYSETFRQTGDIRQARLAAENVRSQQRSETQAAFENQRAEAELRMRNEQAAIILRTRQATGGINPAAEEEALRQQGRTDAQINAVINEAKARIMEQFAVESGQQNDPNIINAIKRLRDPNTDLAARFAADEAKRAAELQQQANLALSKLAQEMADLPKVLSSLDLTLKVLQDRIGIAQQNAMAQPQAQVQQPLMPGQRGPQQQVDRFGNPTGVVSGVVSRSKGGIIYAASGRLINFEPKGTDTVPAMLTPGEFVVNAEATSKHLPLLKAINKSSGGVVYLQDGGLSDAQKTIARTFVDRSSYDDLVRTGKIDASKYPLNSFMNDVVEKGSGSASSWANRIAYTREGSRYRPDSARRHLTPAEKAAVDRVIESQKPAPYSQEIDKLSSDLAWAKYRDESAKGGGFGRDFGIGVSDGSEIKKLERQIAEFELKREADREIAQGSIGTAGSGGAANTPQEAAIEAVNRRQITEARNAPDTRSFSERNFGVGLTAGVKDFVGRGLETAGALGQSGIGIIRMGVGTAGAIGGGLTAGLAERAGLTSVAQYADAFSEQAALEAERGINNVQNAGATVGQKLIDRNLGTNIYGTTRQATQSRINQITNERAKNAGQGLEIISRDLLKNYGSESSQINRIGQSFQSGLDLTSELTAGAAVDMGAGKIISKGAASATAAAARQTSGINARVAQAVETRANIRRFINNREKVKESSIILGLKELEDADKLATAQAMADKVPLVDPILYQAEKLQAATRRAMVKKTSVPDKTLQEIEKIQDKIRKDRASSVAQQAIDKKTTESLRLRYEKRVADKSRAEAATTQQTSTRSKYSGDTDTILMTREELQKFSDDYLKRSKEAADKIDKARKEGAARDAFRRAKRQNQTTKVKESNSLFPTFKQYGANIVDFIRPYTQTTVGDVRRKAMEKFDNLSIENLLKSLTKPFSSLRKTRAKPYSEGGIVYANNGALVSAKQSGTDTIPAMLSKGEYVINRKSVESNLPILQAINSGHYDRGGIVNYLANGGIVAPRYYASGGLTGNIGGVSNTGGVLDSIMGQINALKDTIGNMSNIIPSLENVATSIQNGLQSGAELLSNASNNILTSTEELRNMPTDIRITEQKQINVAGISREWNKYEGDIINMAGENTQQKITNVADRVSRRSEGQINIG